MFKGVFFISILTNILFSITGTKCSGGNGGDSETGIGIQIGISYEVVI